MFINEEFVFYDWGVDGESDFFSFGIFIYCYDCLMLVLVLIMDFKFDMEVMFEELKKFEDIF